MTLPPAGSTQPVTVSRAGALPGEAATQIVSSMWLTKVTWRGPSATAGDDVRAAEFAAEAGDSTKLAGTNSSASSPARARVLWSNRQDQWEASIDRG